MSMRSRPLRLLAVAAAVVVAGSCTPTLDTEGLEGDLAGQLEDELRTEIAEVRCPEDVEAKAGDTFDCTAEEGSGATFVVRVVQQNDQGDVEWSIVDAEA